MSKLEINLECLETLYKMTEEIRIYLNTLPVSIASVQFKKFSEEVNFALNSAIIEAYHKGQLVKTSDNKNKSSNGDKNE